MATKLFNDIFSTMICWGVNEQNNIVNLPSVQIIGQPKVRSLLVITHIIRIIQDTQ